MNYNHVSKKLMSALQDIEKKLTAKHPISGNTKTKQYNHNMQGICTIIWIAKIKMQKTSKIYYKSPDKQFTNSEKLHYEVLNMKKKINDLLQRHKFLEHNYYSLYW